MTYGITSTGFTIPTTQQILDAVNADLQAALGSDLDLSPEQPLGQINGIYAAKLRELWEAAQTVYDARDPANANLGVLDAVCAISGVARREATRGTVSLTVRLDSFKTLPAGSIAHVAGQPTNQWRTTADAVNGTGSPLNVTVAAECVDTGRKPANANTITVIATPVAGWLSVSNATDATAGLDVETDPELRARREREYQTGGSSPADAIRVALSALANVTQVVVFENTTLTTDADGLPPKSVEALVLGGDAQTIAEALWRAKAGGIETYGTETATVFDAVGLERTVHFTRPTDRNLYVEVFPVIDRATYAGDAAVRAAILAEGASLLAGEPVRIFRMLSRLRSVRGIVDVSQLVVGFAWLLMAPANVEIGLRERAVFDTSRIRVTLSTLGA